MIDDDDWLPLHGACFNGHVEVARCLLQKYPNTVDATTSKENHRCTPLHLAAEHGSVNCIEMLLEHGANIEATTSDGRTSLSIAAFNGRLPAVKHLLSKRAQETATGDKGWLPLHWASASGQAECVRTLHEWYRVKLDSKTSLNDDRRTASHLAAASNNCSAVVALLECGANANEQMNDGRTALHLAAAEDCVGCIKRLLLANADATIRNNAGETVLHIAAEVNSCNALRLLRRWQDSRGTVNDQAQQFVYINSRTQNGETALHYSARAGCEQCLRSLFEVRADITIGDHEGRTALHVATLKGSAIAVKQPCEELVQRSSHEASALNQRDNKHRTSLHCAIINSHYDVVSLLLNYGADVQVTDTSAATPLLMAIRKHNLPLTQLLLQYGANVGEAELSAAQQTSHEHIECLLKQAKEEQEQLRLATEPEIAVKVEWEHQLDFKVRGWLGKGAFGEVHKALWRHGEVIMLSRTELKRFAPFAVRANASGSQDYRRQFKRPRRRRNREDERTRLPTIEIAI